MHRIGNLTHYPLPSLIAEPPLRALRRKLAPGIVEMARKGDTAKASWDQPAWQDLAAQAAARGVRFRCFR